MSNQAQCPNCGGYKVEGKVIQIDSKTGKEVSGYGCIITIAAVIISWSAMSFFGFLGSSYGNFNDTAMCIPPVVIALFALLYFILRSQSQSRAYARYDYKCQLCGYTWNLREGQPWPEVKVNPDLIAKGAQKLEQEEEQRRKQQEDAAALYYLTHQGKK